MKVLSAVIILVSIIAALPAMAANEDFPASDQKATLTIHSFAVSDYANLKRGSGTQTDQNDLPDDASKLQDVTFSIQRLDDSEGKAVTVNTSADPAFKEQTGKTDINGQLVFSSLPKGYYLVTQEALSGYTTQKSSFVVMLPMRNQNANGDTSYNYDVHVYPKNIAEPTITKEPAGPQVVGIGDEVIWDINYPVTGSLKEETEGGTIYATDFYLTDTMDNRLDYINNSAEFTVYGSDGIKLNLDIIEGIHYTEVYDEASRTVIWTYTDEGVRAMADSNAASSLVRIRTKINETALGTVDVVWNYAAIHFTNTSGDPYKMEVFALDTDKNAEGVPKVYLGSITIDKYELDQEEIKIAGVTFKVASSKADADSGQFIQTAGGDYQVITDEKGHARFTALGSGEYWLVETQAAKGYKLLEDPLKVVIGETPADANAVISIANQKDSAVPGPGGDDHRKGASGVKTGDFTNIFRLIGIAITALLILFMIWNKRKGKNDQKGNSHGS